MDFLIGLIIGGVATYGVLHYVSFAKLHAKVDSIVSTVEATAAKVEAAVKAKL